MKTEKLIVIAPEGCREWLTPNKEYEIIKIDTDKLGFSIIADEGSFIYCSFKSCGHLKGGDWIIKQEPKTKAYTTQKNEDFFIVWNNENDRSIMIHEDALWKEFKNEFLYDKEWIEQHKYTKSYSSTFDEWITERDKISEYINIFNS